MQAIVSHLNTPPDQHDQFIKHIEEALLAEAREQPGYKACLVLIDPKTGNIIGIALFEDVQAVRDSGFVDAGVAKTEPLLKDPLVLEHWEVGLIDGHF